MPKLSITKSERKKYLLPTKQDYKILEKIKLLEKCSLNLQEKFLVKFARTQLERDWRKYILRELNKLLKKFKQ